MNTYYNNTNTFTGFGGAGHDEAGENTANFTPNNTTNDDLQDSSFDPTEGVQASPENASVSEEGLSVTSPLPDAAEEVVLESGEGEPEVVADSTAEADSLNEADQELFPDPSPQSAIAGEAAAAVDAPSITSKKGFFGARGNDDSGADQPRSRSGLKKALLALGLTVAALLGIYGWGVNNYKDKFLPNTFVSGFNVGGMTLEEAMDTVSQGSSERKVTIKGKDGVESELQASQVGLTLSESPDISETLENQNVYEWPKYLLAENGTKVASAHSIDEAALENTVQSLDIVSGEQMVPTQNAKAVFDGNQFVIQDEVYGTQVDTEKLKEIVKDSLVTGDDVINLEEDGGYVMPAITNKTQTLLDSLKQLNQAINTTVTYDFKTSQEVLDKNTFNTWLSTDENGAMVFDDAQAAAYVKSLADKYDTLGKTITFNSSSSGPIEMTDWYYGWEIDQPAETGELKNIILAGNPVTREPVYSSIGRDRAMGNTISGTYLEISIGDQHMWFYKDGQLITSTPVVTGDSTQGHDTTTGLFEIQDKSTDVVLTDNATYASPVTFWMPFNGGIGVHDSSWRDSYGGSIFQGNGSHGCVNTPYWAAAQIFENISVGDPVVVYW